ncbi:Engulfment and cell motility protein 1 [Portunus trituberculatus]|uniref:Engulfment and cell motility protein 1 n=1 Tax=Portunus trituberculatus TaxID=210409 RepID=A0A5B7DXD8_PORTR|nr:Engulfment and cell motility protein 1 [Portunus trituberculatus]
MAPTRDINVVKLAVEMRAMDSKTVPFLGEFSLQDPLAAFIAGDNGVVDKVVSVGSGRRSRELCVHWKVEHPENFALQYTEPSVYYVTEKNRSKIKDGTVLHLVFSAGKMAEDILLKLRKTPDEKKDALEKLVRLSSDPTFANEFIGKHGMSFLITCLEMAKQDSPMLPLILSSFLELMDHGIMSWDKLEPTFIERVNIQPVAQVAMYINTPTPVDMRTLNSSLTILENIVLNSQRKYTIVEKQVTIPKLLNHISSNKKGEIHQAVLALVNALIQKSEPQKKKWCATLTNRQHRTIIYNNVVLMHNESTSSGSDLAHQLYVLEQLLLNQYEERMNTSMDVNDQDATEKIKELRKIAFESDGEVPSGITPRRPEYKKEYKKLGFKNDINPAQDFKDTPPGMLALDNMIYFARNHTDQYAKLVLENCYRADSHECPFGRASIELTKLLCEILKIGDVPTEQGQSYHPMFFSHDCMFEELFSICIVLLNKTWKEMKATTEDFRELRRALEPDILELIQQHRLRFLVEGTRFKIARGVRAKDKFRYCRLSPNHKFLHYVDGDEKSAPSLDEQFKKISIADIKSVVTGKECPHMKEKAVKKNPVNLAFSVLLDSTETTSVDFVAPDERTYNYWVDGLNALHRQTMPSPQTSADLEILLNMEIKLRLLDAEGVTIPSSPPPIPPPPPNYSFCYQLP